MKKLIMVAIILIASVSVFAQDNGTSAEWKEFYSKKKGYKDVSGVDNTISTDAVDIQNNFIPDTLFVDKVNDLEYTKRYKNNEKFLSIKLVDGSVLKVGDIVTLGRPSGFNTSKQVNAGLLSSNVTTTNSFQYILMGRIGLSAMIGAQYLPQSLQGSKAVIKEIKASHTSIVGSRNSPLTYWLILDYGYGVATILNVQAALTNGEFINPNASMTRDQAIAKLKEQKDLLDLGMINKEEFEKIKGELSPIVMKN